MSNKARGFSVAAIAVFILAAILLAPGIALADNWVQVNTDGFGGPNARASSSTTYDSNLYVGTENPTTGCQVWRYDGAAWTQVNADGFSDSNNTSATSMFVHGSNLYVGTENTVTGGEVWMYDGSTWTQVNDDGFDGTDNRRVSSMKVARSLLYASTANDNGCEVWRYGGVPGNWTCISQGGFGDTDNYDGASLGVRQDNLHVGTRNDADGCEVWIYCTLTFNWTQRGDVGFGDANNVAATSMVEHKYTVFVGTLNAVTGTQVWRYDNPEWTRVNDDGFGDVANDDASSMAAWGSCFYVGTANASGCQVWRYRRGTWSRPVTGGFSDAGNTSATCMAMVGDDRYVGTENAATGCEVWSDKHRWIDSVNPDSGAYNHTLDVEIVGVNTGFIEGVSQATFAGSEITVNSTTVTDPTHVTANITISQGTGTGLRYVNVITGDEEPDDLYGFRVRNPKVNNTDPDGAVPGQTLDVEITGYQTVWVEGDSQAVFSPDTGITVNSTTVESPTSVTANITIDGDATGGKRDVNVVNDDETPKPYADGFNIIKPRISTVNPNHADQGRTLNVTVYGIDTNFIDGVSQAAFSGTGITVNSTMVHGPACATANITIDLNAPPVPRDVNVITGGETPDLLVEGFTIDHWSTITTANPDSGARGQTLDVEITGNNTCFEDGDSQATFSGTGITVNSTTVADATHATANVTVADDATTGARDVNVLTGGETPDELSGGFTVRDARVVSTEPDSGAQGQTLDIEITGESTAFQDGDSQATFSGTGITVNSTTVADATHATANVTVADDATPGARDVNVLTGGEVPDVLSGGFTVRDARVVSIEPQSVDQGRTLYVEITGENTAFGNGDSQATFSGTGVTVNFTSVADPTHATASITIADDVTPGARDVNVITGGEVPDFLADGFTVTDPKILLVNPDSGPRGRTLDVEITGSETKFAAGTSEAVFSGADIIVNSTTVESSTVVTANVTIEPGASLSERDVNVLTNGQVPDPLEGGFTVKSGDPVIESVSPARGAPGDTITIKGSLFGSTQGSSRIDFDGVRSNSYPSWSDDRVQCVIPGDARSSKVSVTTNIGTSNQKSFIITNTPAGKNVEVEPGSDVSLEFDEVTDSGQTDADPADDPGIAGYEVAKGTCHRVTTDAEFEGDVTVTLHYPDSQFSAYEESYLALLHREGGRWVNRTMVRDPDADTVTASVGDFSEFVVAFPRFSSTWYLAEGSTNWGFGCYLSLENPNPVDVVARVTFMTESGPVEVPDVVLKAETRATLNPEAYVGNADFSTRVICDEGLPIAVDRTMTWKGPGAPSPEGHASIGVNLPDTTWYLPEGSSAWGFECWLLIGNPNDEEATCEVTYMIEGEGPKVFTRSVPANSRRTYNMADDIGAKDASIKVEADIPVIPERAMYRNSRRSGHDSIGTTIPSTDYYLTEGTTDWGFTTYVLIQNPNNTPAAVEVTYITPGGPLAGPAFTMPPHSRETIRVNDQFPGLDLSTTVHADVPIVAERAMYWGGGTVLGEACHDSIGMSAPHATFYFPDGRASGGYETWTIVGNPNDCDVDVEIRYLASSSGQGISFAATVPANSRRSFNMGDSYMTDTRAAVVVRCVTVGRKIMAERAMYWNNRGAGTDTIGGYID